MSRSSFIPLTLADKNTLLPPSDVEKEYPPIYLNLNADALELLRQAVDSEEAESSPLRMMLTVSDRNASLQLNDLEFQAAQYKEPGYVEIYAPDGTSTSTFRSQGQISSRITLKQEKPLKLVEEAESVELDNPTAQKIIQLLAVKPHTAADIAAKVQSSRTLVVGVLDQVAKKSENGNVYALKDAFKPSAPSAPASRQPTLEPPASASTNGSAESNSHASTAGRERSRERLRSPQYATESSRTNSRESSQSPSSALQQHPASTQRSTGKPKDTKLPTLSINGLQSKIESNKTPISKLSDKSSTSASGSSRNDTTSTSSSGATSRNVSSVRIVKKLTVSEKLKADRANRENMEKTRAERAATDKNKTDKNTTADSIDLTDDNEHRMRGSEPSAKRVKREELSTDMFELARKFRESYDEYRELYALLQHRKSRPPSQVQKLMEMHNQLASWKEKLWSNARSKGQVK